MSNPIKLAEKIEALLQTADMATAHAALHIAEILFEHRIKGDAAAVLAGVYAPPETKQAAS